MLGAQSVNSVKQQERVVVTRSIPHTPYDCTGTAYLFSI
jgi:hypothetical protein